MKNPLKTLLSVLVLSVAFNLYFNQSNSNAQNQLEAENYKNTKSATNQKNSDSKTQISDDFLAGIIKKVKSDYVEEKSDQDLAKAAANGILTSLDPHSSYLSMEDFTEVKVQTSGEFGGIGIEITLENSLIKIVSPIEGTPAYKAGIKAGDYISKIDGKPAIGIALEEAVDKLRGKPNSKVNLTILRKGQESPVEFSIKREIIRIKAVRSETYQDVGYIKINSFSGQTYQEVADAIEKIYKNVGAKNIKGIILDLRNNPGGLLDQSIKVSDIFLDKNQVIVSIKGRAPDSNKEYVDSENQTITKNIPVIVLINEGSASASEIVAGALQDNKRALVLGQKSFGKGSVQSIIPLDNNQGAIRMTTALYYTPSGKSIQAKGITPDVIVTEAKIEKIDNSKFLNIHEADLNGHIKNGNEQDEKLQIDDHNIDLYNKDYQLARAVDLVRGISFYKKLNGL